MRPSFGVVRQFDVREHRRAGTACRKPSASLSNDEARKMEDAWYVEWPKIAKEEQDALLAKGAQLTEIGATQKGEACRMPGPPACSDFTMPQESEGHRRTSRLRKEQGPAAVGSTGPPHASGACRRRASRPPDQAHDGGSGQRDAAVPACGRLASLHDGMSRRRFSAAMLALVRHRGLVLLRSSGAIFFQCADHLGESVCVVRGFAPRSSWRCPS